MIWLEMVKRDSISYSGLKKICCSSHIRYDRQILLPEIGNDGQELLAGARVLVVGAGGLGSPILLYLAAAGVGTIGIVDYDTVGWSNLNRQILYRESDIGHSKVSVAAQRVRELNSAINVVEHFGKLSSCDDEKKSRQTPLQEVSCSCSESGEGLPGNTICLDANGLVKGYDIVVDACDNLATRHLVGNVTAKLGVPYVYGAIDGFCGQISVFNYGEGTQRKRFSDLWPEDSMSHKLESPDLVMPSVGVTAGVVGTLQASETIKIISGYGDVLAGQLLTVDLRTLEICKFNL